MTSTMSFRALVRQDSQSSNSGREGSLKKKNRLWHRNSINNSKGSLKSRSGDKSAGIAAARRQVLAHTRPHEPLLLEFKEQCYVFVK